MVGAAFLGAFSNWQQPILPESSSLAELPQDSRSRGGSGVYPPQLTGRSPVTMPCFGAGTGALNCPAQGLAFLGKVPLTSAKDKRYSRVFDITKHFFARVTAT